jgi:dethiobiotin synthetase
MSFRIANIRNRPSVKSFTNYFEIRTYTEEEYKIDLSTLTTVQNLDLQTASFTTLVLKSPVSPIVTGALATYEIQIISFNGIYPQSKGKMEIIFPPEIKFNSAGVTCQA